VTTPEWTFNPTSVKQNELMTLVLAKRRNKTLQGYKVEFAKGATDELRKVVAATIDLLGTLTPRQYEPSLAIKKGEYLAVPDELVKQAAPPLPPNSPSKATAASPGDEDTSGEDAEPAQEATSSTTAGNGQATAHIETDPEVRKLLRSAAGLPPLPAKALSGQPFQFYAVVIGDIPELRSAFVRKHGPTTGLGKGRLLFAHGGRLTRVSEPLLALDPSFDLVVTPEGIAAISQSAFDNLFRDAATLVARYPHWATAFATLGLDDGDTEVLVQRCRRDGRLATRLRQIYESGHLEAGKVTITAVLAQADELGIDRATISAKGRLDFAKPDVATLLKLLNDDIFIGGLSKVRFEAGSKARQQQE